MDIFLDPFSEGDEGDILKIRFNEFISDDHSHEEDFKKEVIKDGRQ